MNVVTRDVALSALRGAVNELLYNPDVDKSNGKSAGLTYTLSSSEATEISSIALETCLPLFSFYFTL